MTHDLNHDMNNILLHTQSIVYLRLDSQCLEYLGCITWKGVLLTLIQLRSMIFITTGTFFYDVVLASFERVHFIFLNHMICVTLVLSTNAKTPNDYDDVLDSIFNNSLSKLLYFHRKLSVVLVKDVFRYGRIDKIASCSIST